MMTGDGEEERLLRDNLQVRALSPEALRRVREVTEAEWRAHIESPARPRWTSYATAASGALVAGAGAWAMLARGAYSEEPLAQLARTEGPGVIEVHALWHDAAVHVGSEIQAGRSIQARGASLFALRGGGNLRVAPGSRLQILSGNSVRLESGEM